MSQPDQEFKPKPMQRRGAARRRAMLDAAAAIFLEKGYERSSVAEIVARAGGSKSLLYEQFKDKAGLFEAMMVERCAEILEPLKREMGEADDPCRTLTRLGRQFVRVLASDDAIALQRIVYSEGARNPDIADIFFGKGHEIAYDKLTDFLSELAPGTTDEIRRRWAILFFAMLQGDATQRILAGVSDQPTQKEIDGYIDNAVTWLVGCADSPASRNT
ncbi:TetR/AcrR family transcriptional regulator [Sphingomonas parva]|uniref:TetR/AcrR family transcriptional regulator n=1 Tax=Sphingomonas parva TaxID=2555898 RepID=A0A4Y8ZQH3_9SPHN|nr:TetR/AcrR family transcriptional regulator [Sphingomonas parva]TFI58268.1 TetR/AcrR family transcriptional regulator [Sphingomonas parva]